MPKKHRHKSVRRKPEQAPRLPTFKDIDELMRRSRQSVEEIDGILDAAMQQMIERLTMLQGM